MANPVYEVLLTERELESSTGYSELAAGAIVDFFGVVRLLEAGREISGIDYEAHRPMAQHQLRAIAEEAIEKFALERVIIHHRLGFVATGETSLWLRVAAGHRAEAFEASEWMVNQLKLKVPIWKHPKFKIHQDGMNKAVVRETI